MTDNKMTWEQELHAKMIANAMHASGIMGTLENQIQEGIKAGKVSIAEAQEHRRLLAANAARSMAMGIEAALRTLANEGFEIVKRDSGDSGERAGSVSEDQQPELPGLVHKDSSDGLPTSNPA